MLTKLRIVNFKCLQDTGELDIRPLTFLVGPNSSGKTSVLQMLLMLRQTVDSRDMENPLTPNDGWVKLGSYPDFIFGQDPKRKLEVNLFFQGSLEPIRLESAMFHFNYNRKTTQIRLEMSELRGDEGEVWGRVFRTHTGRRYRAEMVLTVEGKPEEMYGPLDVNVGKFYLATEFHPKRSERRSLFMVRSLLLSLGLGIENELKQVYYLGPLRDIPQRSYTISGQAPMDVGTRGERTAEVLWYATRTKERQEEMLKEVNRWLQEFGIALEARLERLGQSSQYQVLFVDPTSKLAVNLTDAGFGASQVLPVIVEGFYASSGSLLLVEQPEIHLHPRAQATLGSLLVEIAKRGDRRLIVETHSEHVLGRVQRHIAEEKIGRDEVAIYYFNPGPEGTQIQEVTLNEVGQFEEFPEGFFEEGFEEAIAHAKAISHRTARGT